MDSPIIEVLSSAGYDVYEPPQAESIILVDKMMTMSEGIIH